MKDMNTEPERQFEQVDGLSLMDGFSDEQPGRWVERTEGALWGLCGGFAIVVIVVLAVAGVAG